MSPKSDVQTSMSHNMAVGDATQQSSKIEGVNWSHTKNRHCEKSQTCHFSDVPIYAFSSEATSFCRLVSVTRPVKMSCTERELSLWHEQELTRIDLCVVSRRQPEPRMQNSETASWKWERMVSKHSRLHKHNWLTTIFLLAFTIKEATKATKA